MKRDDSTFQISGKQLHVKGRSVVDAPAKRYSEARQQHGTIIVPNRLAADTPTTRISSDAKDASSINLIVGTGCFKKDNDATTAKRKDDVSNMDQELSADSSEEMAEFVTSWSVLLSSCHPCN